MSDSAEPELSLPGKVLRYTRENPVAILVLALGGVGGALAATMLDVLPDSIPVWRRAVGGALAGLFFALFPLGERLYR